MIDEVFPNIFRMEIPLPGNPLKAINSYVIKGEERFLIVDTGMNREECFQAMRAGLAELQVDLERTDFFITHIHADHMGLISHLVQNSNRVYFNPVEARIMADETHWEGLLAQAGANGFPEPDLQNLLQKHPGHKYRPQGRIDFTLLKEGDRLRIGEYDLETVATPGHTWGHTCLYESRTRILFSGDHILASITPNISQWTGKEDPLRLYLQSLDKMRAYDVALVLPGHRRPFSDHRCRIAELEKHHEVRAEEVVFILRQGRKNAYQVASQMTWDIDCKSWDEFPLPQKWFASGEALAHLQYLLGEGRVRRELEGGKAFFTLA